MRQGIVTRYMGPTNSSGARVKATARKAKTWSDGSRDPALQLTDHWDHASNIEANHARVAQLLAVKLEWSGLWIGGGAPDESGFQFVNAGDAPLARRWAEEEFGKEGVDWLYVAPRKA